MANRQKTPRLAIIVSHPIQYYVPLYQRLAARSDIEIKVFFTWHAANQASLDHGFGCEIKWDIPLTEAYDFELVANRARRPGTHHFWGLRNPSLVHGIDHWAPDAVHLTGYPFCSHLKAARYFYKRKIPVLFRGDSHLLDRSPGWRWNLKRYGLSRIFLMDGWLPLCGKTQLRLLSCSRRA